jgi:hypothetical protein
MQEYIVPENKVWLIVCDCVSRRTVRKWDPEIGVWDAGNWKPINEAASFPNF